MIDRPARSVVRLLLVEDNPGDARWLEETLRGAPWQVDMPVVRDGEEALRYLRQEGSYREAARPDLMLLDLNLPGMDGREVLAKVRGDERLNGIPIIIFTSSPADDDVRLAFRLHADGYLRKPVRLGEFAALVERLGLVPPPGPPATPGTGDATGSGG
jgi:two-component system, chemotaxis family, response regulator Rcp1